MITPTDTQTTLVRACFVADDSHVLERVREGSHLPKQVRRGRAHGA